MRKMSTLSHPSSHSRDFIPNMNKRQRAGALWRLIFLASTVFGMVALGILLSTIVNDTFGYTALSYKTDPTSLTTDGKPLEQATQEELIAILESNLRTNRLKTLNNEKPLYDRTKNELQDLVVYEVVQPIVVAVWGLSDSIFRRDEIPVEATEIAIQKNIDPKSISIVFKNWLNRDFLVAPQASDALYAGVRTAILGSLFVIAITILFAFPIGIGAAVYLQEYAQDNRVNRLIQANINNLAGVPSIIYGMLGLTIFVRALAVLTSGSLSGYPEADPNNGRTILSAGLTMALVILPVIIINGQEAIKAVPNSLREAAYGLGGNQMADHLASRAAERAGWDPDWNNPGDLTSDW